MTVVEELLRANADSASGHRGDLSAPPARRLAVVTCMDARIDPLAVLGLGVGEAHVIRNAGGVVTDDVIRSLAISQRLLATTTVVVMQHTDCGMSKKTDAEVAAILEDGSGRWPLWPIGTFTDVTASVRAAVATLRAETFLAARDDVHGLVFDVATGRVSRVG